MGSQKELWTRQSTFQSKLTSILLPWSLLPISYPRHKYSKNNSWVLPAWAEIMGSLISGNQNSDEAAATPPHTSSFSFISSLHMVVSTWLWPNFPKELINRDLFYTRGWPYENMVFLTPAVNPVTLNLPNSPVQLIQMCGPGVPGSSRQRHFSLLSSPSVCREHSFAWCWETLARKLGTLLIYLFILI